MRGRRVILGDPERARKNDFAPSVRMSSVEMRWSFADRKEGELGTELEERARGEGEGSRESGREAHWERGDLLGEEEWARRRKEKGRRSFKFDFAVLPGGTSGDVRMVGVDRALERVETGETEGESATAPSGRSFGAGTVCWEGLASDCGSSNKGSAMSKRSLRGSGRGAKRMRRVEGAEV